MSRDQVKFSLQKYPIVHILNFTRHPSYLSPRYFLVPLPRPHPLTRFPPATSSAVAGHVLWSPPTSFSGPSPSSFLAFSSPRAGPSTYSGSTDCKSHRRHLFRQLSATAVTNLVHLLLLNVVLLLNRTLKAASPLFPELPVHILSPMCSAAAGNMLSSPATCCWPRHLSLTFPDPRSTLGGILLPSTGPYSNPRRGSFVSPPQPQPALPASSVQWGLPPPDQFSPPDLPPPFFQSSQPASPCSTRVSIVFTSGLLRSPPLVAGWPEQLREDLLVPLLCTRGQL